MQKTSVCKSAAISLAAAIALLGLGAIQAKGQSVIYDFSDGTADGWANSGFNSTPVPAVTNISGLNYIVIPLGGFQVANVSSGSGSAFFNAMAAAAANPAGYDISYTYYINTANFSGTTFLQLGTFVNSGSGYYAQDYGASELQLSGTQIASGQVFQGTVTINMAAAGYAPPAADTFFRLGLIENANGSGVVVDFSNISVTPVPEPTSLALFGLGLAAAGTALIRRRKA